MKSRYDKARATTQKAYPAGRERRLRFALASKAKLGVFIPSQGGDTSADGQAHITKRLHATINFRAKVLSGQPTAAPRDRMDLSNLLVSFRTARDRGSDELREAMQRRKDVADNRTRMTVRRWMHRLGWLGQRGDRIELEMRDKVRFKYADEFRWETSKDYHVKDSGVVLMAGTPVYWDGYGFYSGRGASAPSVQLNGEAIDAAGVRRVAHKQSQSNKRTNPWPKR